MEASKTNKGQLMEENLRNYFLDMGYYVSRGVKYTFKDSESTDIDLFLYNRPTILTRERINVDIKNRKTPQAMERIFVAKGIQSILKLDKCIVATKDCREIVKEFASLNGVIILDGNFLSKLNSKINADRFTEEEFTDELNKNSLGKLSGDWSSKIEKLKTSLLSEYDYSGCIHSLESIKYFILESLTNINKKDILCRCIYLLHSFFLIKLDFVLKDVAYLENDKKLLKLADGLKYGNIGESGAKKFIALAQQLLPSNQRPNLLEAQIRNMYDTIPVSMIAEYYTKNEVSKNLFKNAKEFEKLTYLKAFITPNQIDIELRSIISLTLDYFQIDRKKFFINYDIQK